MASIRYTTYNLLWTYSKGLPSFCLSPTTPLPTRTDRQFFYYIDNVLPSTETTYLLLKDLAERKDSSGYLKGNARKAITN